MFHVNYKSPIVYIGFTNTNTTRIQRAINLS